ncbi:hypothetical protein DY000_02005129 [Brassica cretica]|uniref:Uncharacterized protein n=1 Tax=Brassica cretica TaxID=69181 RepID=A0ABQ7CCZ5_BRACR|nr:hypothetical protein DY000_02005127 [Brassica cretica]KAF3549511.1 hypothetical protein DY000_02005129 [Brassica cretica]
MEWRRSRRRCFLASVGFHSIVTDNKLDLTGARLPLNPDGLRPKIKSLSFSVNPELYSSLPQPSCACRKVSDTKDRSAQSLGVVQSDMILPTSISPIRSSLELFDGFTATGTKLREEEKRDFESITSSSRHLVICFVRSTSSPSYERAATLQKPLHDLISRSTFLKGMWK